MTLGMMDKTLAVTEFRCLQYSTIAMLWIVQYYCKVMDSSVLVLLHRWYSTILMVWMVDTILLLFYGW